MLMELTQQTEGLQDCIFEAHENLNNQLTGIAYAESPMEASDKGLEIVEDIQDSQNSLRAA